MRYRHRTRARDSVTRNRCDRRTFGKITGYTEPREELYVLSNFNDFGSAVVTLFELLVVNNWRVLRPHIAHPIRIIATPGPPSTPGRTPLSSRRYVIMDAFVSLTSEWARVYFITWHADAY